MKHISATFLLAFVFVFAQAQNGTQASPAPTLPDKTLLSPIEQAPASQPVPQTATQVGSTITTLKVSDPPAPVAVTLAEPAPAPVATSPAGIRDQATPPPAHPAIVPPSAKTPE